MLGVSAKLVNIDTRELASMLAPPLVAALIMFAMLALVRWLIADVVPGLFPRFAILTICGVSAYGLSIYFIAAHHCGDVRDLIARIRAK